MRDKLTKKRVKVDYLLVIKCADLESEFLRWQQHKKNKISFNRQAYSFCKHKKVDVDGIYQMCLDHGINNFDQYLDELIRIAKTPWLDED